MDDTPTAVQGTVVAVVGHPALAHLDPFSARLPRTHDRSGRRGGRSGRSRSRGRSRGAARGSGVGASTRPASERVVTHPRRHDDSVDRYSKASTRGGGSSSDEPHEILDCRRRGRGVQYLVRFSGTGKRDRWLSGTDIGGYTELMRAFEAAYPELAAQDVAAERRRLLERDSSGNGQQPAGAQRKDAEVAEDLDGDGEEDEDEEAVADGNEETRPSSRRSEHKDQLLQHSHAFVRGGGEEENESDDDNDGFWADHENHPLEALGADREDQGEPHGYGHVDEEDDDENDDLEEMDVGDQDEGWSW